MDNVLEIKNINKKYGKKQVLHDISFHIGQREIVGFIGHNGAGKSTLMKCVLSLIFPNSGDIIVNGHNLREERIKALASMAGVIEDPGLFKDLSGQSNIRLFAELRGADEQRIREIMDFTELGSDLNRKAGEYSMGMKQRLALGIALISKPKLLILDEPTNGLDPPAVMKLRETLFQLVEKENMSILFSSHQLEEVEKLSNRLVCINKGKIVDLDLMENDMKKYIFHLEEREKLIKYLLSKDLKHRSIDENTVEITLEKNLNLQALLVELSDINISVLDVESKEISLEDKYDAIYRGVTL